MRVLVGCECSGRVRDAFRAAGHDAWSCDLVPSEAPGPHLQGDVLGFLGGRGGLPWDVGVFFPPCTYLTKTGARHFDRPGRRALQEDALEFFRRLLDAPIPMTAVENPIGVASTRIRPPDQIVQPCWFGDPVQKATGLWLRGLPPLVPTRPVEPEFYYPSNGSRRMAYWFYETSLLPHRERSRARSVTFPGLALAMAEQWGRLSRPHRRGLGVREALSHRVRERR